ncbi:G-protein coupled receptor GRL101-like protein, partial [Trichoplax sp. H2]
DISYNNLVRNGIRVEEQVLFKLLKLPPAILLAGNNIKSIPMSFLKWNLYIRTFSIGSNNMSLSAIEQAMRGLYIADVCVPPKIYRYLEYYSCNRYSLDLSDSRLNKIPSGSFVHLNGLLRVLKLNNNYIKTIDASAIFRDSDSNLRELHLANNKISNFTNPNKVQFIALRLLNLTRNRLANICGRSELLGVASNLLEISIKSNPLVTLQDISFYGSTTLGSVASTRAYLCCIVPAKVTTCSPAPDLDSASSCENILAHSSLQLAVWIMALAAFIGNILVIANNRSNKNRKISKATELVFTNLAISDFLMSLYLIIIGIGDFVYRDRYAQYSEEWLRSPACVVASFLICTSSLMSVLMMLFIGIDRYSIASNPFLASDTRYKRTKISLLLGWLLTSIFVGIPISIGIDEPGDRRLYQFSSICTPSNLSNNFYAGWTIAFVVLQLVCWMLTLTLYLKLVATVNKTQRSVRSSAQSRSFAVAIRISLILITDLMAWLPVYVISVMSIIQGTLNVFILQFAVILAIPLNSAINPYIYTATGTACFNRLTSTNKSKSVYSSTTRNISMHQNSTYGNKQKRTRVAPFSKYETIINEDVGDSTSKAINDGYQAEPNQINNSTTIRTANQKTKISCNEITTTAIHCAPDAAFLLSMQRNKRYSAPSCVLADMLTTSCDHTISHEANTKKYLIIDVSNFAQTHKAKNASSTSDRAAMSELGIINPVYDEDKGQNVKPVHNMLEILAVRADTSHHLCNIYSNGEKDKEQYSKPNKIHYRNMKNQGCAFLLYCNNALPSALP